MEKYLQYGDQLISLLYKDIFPNDKKGMNNILVNWAKKQKFI